MPASPDPKSQYGIINSSNEGLIFMVSRIMEQYMKAEGLTDRTLAKKIGCSHMTIFYLRKRRVPYCRVSFLSRITLAFDCNLIDWIRYGIEQGIDRDL